MRSFVKEVKVTDNEVLLTYTIPMAPKGITEEEMGVPPIVTIWWAEKDSNLRPLLYQSSALAN